MANFKCTGCNVLCEIGAEELPHNACDDMIYECDCCNTEMKIGWYACVEVRCTGEGNRAHKHAEIMKMYVKDAAEHERPWKLWEYHHIHDGAGQFHPCKDHPKWHINTTYRRKRY